MVFLKKTKKLFIHPIKFFQDISKKNKQNKKSMKENGNELNISVMQKEYQRIISFPSVYPVQLLKWNNTSLWPAFRYYLIQRSLYYYKKMLTHAQAERMVFNTLSPPPLWRKVFQENHNVVEVSHYQPERADFLFISTQNTIVNVLLNGISYDCVIDPVIKKAAAYGSIRKLMFLTGLGNIPLNFKYKPDLLLHPLTYHQENYKYIEVFNDFSTAIVNHLPNLKLSHPVLSQVLDMFISEYRDYLGILEKVKPRVIFSLPCGFMQTALLMAAKDLKIPIVDLQHGNVDKNSIIYNHWQELPYLDHQAAIADYYFVWGDYFKQILRDAFPETSKVLTIGNPWLDYLDSLEIPYQFPEELSVFCDKFKYIVCYTCSMASELPQFAIDIISHELADKFKIGFLIKQRPGYKPFSVLPRTENFLILNDKLLPRMPLYLLTRIIHLNICDGSTSAIEVDYAGINTLAFGDASWHFEGLIASGRMKYIKNADEFYENFPEAVNSCRFPRIISPASTDRLDHFFRDIVSRDA